MRFPNPRAATFYRRAAAFIEQAKGSGGAPLAVVRPKTEEWNRWQAYFTHLGWEPSAWTLARKGDLQSVTLPCQWPEWFDTEFALAEPQLAPPSAPAVEPRYMRETLEQLHARFGKTWGLSVGQRGWHPLPADRITWRDGRRRKPQMPVDVEAGPKEDPNERLARLRETPIPDASPQLLKAIAERDKAHAG